MLVLGGVPLPQLKWRAASRSESIDSAPLINRRVGRKTKGSLQITSTCFGDIQVNECWISCLFEKLLNGSAISCGSIEADSAQLD